MIETLLIAVAIFVSGVFVSEGTRRKSELKICRAQILDCRKDLRGCFEVSGVRTEAHHE